jgi:hypothetical protein
MLLNPLDLIWFVPAWGSRGIVFIVAVYCAIICFFLTVTGFIQLNPVFCAGYGLDFVLSNKERGRISNAKSFSAASQHFHYVEFFGE